MNIEKWNTLYQNNLRLDKIFVKKYGNDTKFYEKNSIELLVEIGEFINETKIFKYWTIKKPNEARVLEECADVITMILSFYGVHDLKINKIDLELNKDILNSIIDLYSFASSYSKNRNVDNLTNAFKNVLEIIYSLGYEEEEIIDAIKEKQEIIEKRLNSNY